MTSRFTRCAVAALTALALLAPAAGAAPERHGVLAGAASADITAPVGTPMFAYTARSYLFSPDPAATQERALQMIADPDTGLYAKSFEPSKGMHTRVLARAIVLKSDGRKYALAQADLGGLPYAMTQEVARRIRRTGITADRLLLSATHTHSSMGAIWPADNSGYAFVGGDAFDPRTFEIVAKGIAESIVEADERLQPAKVGVGDAQLEDASRNREYDVYLRNKDIPSDPAAQRARSVDTRVSVVRVDRADGTPMAVWSNFAIHPTSFGDGNLLFSGDNAGVAARLTEAGIERQAGKTARRRGKDAPEVVNVWTNGAEGDTSPDGDNRKVGGEWQDYVPTDAAKAHLAGARTAAGILRAWHDAGEHLERDVDVAARRMLFTFDGTRHGAEGRQEPVGPYPVLGAGVASEKRPSITKPGSQEPNCAPVDDLAGPGQGEKMPLVGGPGLAPTTQPVSVWRVGRLGIAAYPSEITKQMGERIQTALRLRTAGAVDHVAIAGMTNSYLSYTATPEEYGACTYEGSFTLMGRQMGYAWLAAGAALTTALVKDEPAPAGAIEPPLLAVGTGEDLPARATPEAGTAVAQPKDTSRYGRVSFSWRGGDPKVDAPRGRTFVRLERRHANRWRTVATDDAFANTTRRGAGDLWTETHQLDACAPTGTHRFRVTGRAVKADGTRPAAYALASESFEVRPVAIAAGTPSVVDGTASVRPLYPDPGAALMALPRLVRDASVAFVLADGSRVAAEDPDDDGVYTARVGSAGVERAVVEDDCDNRG